MQKLTMHQKGITEICLNIAVAFAMGDDLEAYNYIDHLADYYDLDNPHWDSRVETMKRELSADIAEVILKLNRR